MLEFNVGELATRLRSALGVRGRIPLGLDEHVIPVAITADVNAPPWRTNPVFAQASFTWAETSAGLHARIFLAWSTATIGPNRNSVFILTGFQIQPLSLTTATQAAVAANGAVATWDPIVGGVAGIPLITTERRSVPIGPSLVPWELPLHLAGGGTLTAPDPAAAGTLAHVRAGAVQPPVFVPSQTLLRPGQGIVFTSTAPAVAGTSSSGLIINVQGLFFGLGG